MSGRFVESVVGGMLGAAVLIAIVGGVSIMYMGEKYAVNLPLLVNASSANKSQILVFAELLSCKKSSKATLVIDSFKVAVPSNDLFNSVTALIPLPSSCMPVSKPDDVPVKLYASNGKDLVDGTISMGLDGSVTISTSSPSVAGGAWGLAEKSEISFDIVKK